MYMSVSENWSGEKGIRTIPRIGSAKGSAVDWPGAFSKVYQTWQADMWVQLPLGALKEDEVFFFVVNTYYLEEEEEEWFASEPIESLRESHMSDVMAFGPANGFWSHLPAKIAHGEKAMTWVIWLLRKQVNGAV
ncbi:hypothetical protein K438DRAFT_1752550 [Mycena galopus ATCC 62051]|nr:hypothetical protein K438DRAFT_1752550 [Mycena galopus ATCC 62051]